MVTAPDWLTFILHHHRDTLSLTPPYPLKGQRESRHRSCDPVAVQDSVSEVDPFRDESFTRQNATVIPGPVDLNDPAYFLTLAVAVIVLFF